MDARELPAHATTEQFKELAKDLVNAYRSGDPEALRRLEDHFKPGHPLTRNEIRKKVHERLLMLKHSSGNSWFGLAKGLRRLMQKLFFGLRIFRINEAQLIIAYAYGFRRWHEFAKHIEELDHRGSQVSIFESAVDAIITGDTATLNHLLHENPDLIRARSMRSHQSNLLHYVSANGVEDFRQKSPANAVEIAEILIKAGADVNAESEAYGGGSTTLGLVATSIHPAKAGVQIELLETLLKYGAVIDGPSTNGGNAVNGCLANGRPEAAEFLARHGGRLDFEGAAGVGRLDLVKSSFNEDGTLKPTTSKSQMESGFMWACEFGQSTIVEFLLDKCIDVATQVHGMTGLHWAVIGGHLDTIKLLLERKAPLEIKNCYGGTVLGQATWAVNQSDTVYRWPNSDTDWAAIVKMLIDAGAKVEEADYPTGNERVDEVLRRHGANP